MTINVTVEAPAREVAPLTAEPTSAWPASIAVGIACYDGMTAAERRAHNLGWQRVRDPQAGIVQVPAGVCCGAGYLSNEYCDGCGRMVSVDAVTLAALESGTWPWSAPDARGGV